MIRDKIKKFFISLVAYPVSIMMSWSKVAKLERDAEIISASNKTAMVLQRKKYGISREFQKLHQFSRSICYAILGTLGLGTIFVFLGIETGSSFLTVVPAIVIIAVNMSMAMKLMQEKHLYHCMCNQVLHPLQTKYWHIDAKNIYGDTLLHMAIERRKYKEINSLVKQGSDPMLKNGNGKTGLKLMCALQDKQPLIYQLGYRYIRSKVQATLMPYLIPLLQMPRLPMELSHMIASFTVQSVANRASPAEKLLYAKAVAEVISNLQARVNKVYQDRSLTMPSSLPISSLQLGESALPDATVGQKLLAFQYTSLSERQGDQKETLSDNYVSIQNRQSVKL